jgi:hypothetical protein
MEPKEIKIPDETPKPRGFLDRLLRRPEPPKEPTAVDTDTKTTQASVEKTLGNTYTPDPLRESAELIQVGHFLVKPSDPAAKSFAERLSTSYDTHRTSLNLDEIKKPNRLESVHGEEKAKIAKRILETQDPEHKKKAKIRVDGIYRIGEINPLYEETKNHLGNVTSSWNDSPSAPRLLLHGTDKSRGCTIMNNGFKRIHSHKTDAHPMFGSGISTCATGSKAGKYFHEGGYNSRTKEDGLIFCIEAAAGKVKDVEVGMWGDKIDGQDWWEQYDTIHAVASRAKDPGNSSRVYHDEWTIGHPKQASIKYVAHCTYIPASDPEYNTLP